MHLAFIEKAFVRRHRSLAAFADAFHNGGIRCAVQPDIVRKIRSANGFISGPVCLVAGRAQRIEFSLATCCAQAVKCTSPEPEHIVHYIAHVLVTAQRGADNPFPGGTNPDGSLRPTAPLTRLFTQDAYTEYAILDPGSESFRIRFLTEETRPGATELVNATRGGSEGSDIQVFDPRTGKPMPFTYEQDPKDPETHAIHAKLPIPVPEGGIGRALIYKTYKDSRTYMMHNDDIVWVRSLSGYRLGVLLPKGFVLTAQ